jgi:hypothetical protein
LVVVVGGESHFAGSNPEFAGRSFCVANRSSQMIKIKEWLSLILKTFVNDCSIGLLLICIGFITGLCFISLLNSLKNICKLFGI